MKGNDFPEIESAFKKISHKLNLEFFRKSSSISNEKKRISSKMQINCIFNHNQNKEIIPKSGIFFLSEIYFQFITFMEEENKISREINLLPNVLSAYTFLYPLGGE